MDETSCMFCTIYLIIGLIHMYYMQLGHVPVDYMYVLSEKNEYGLASLWNNKLHKL